MRALRGLASGVLGTVGMAGFSITMRRMVQPQAPMGKTHYERVVEIGHETALPNAEPLDRDTQIRLAELAHLGFGGFWGVVWALSRQNGDIKPFVEGTMFGTGVWALAFGAYMPGLGLAKGLWEMDAYEFTRTWGSHAAFGIATSLALDALTDD